MTDYHLVNRIRSGIFNSNLQQDLQKQDTLTTVEQLITYCEAFENALKDKERLSRLDDPHACPTPSINSSSLKNQFDLTNDELIAAISLYKKKKKTGYRKVDSIKSRSNTDNNTCNNCGYASHRVDATCPASDRTCILCNRKGHFASVCRSATKTVSASAIVIATVCHVNKVNRPLPQIDITIRHQLLTAIPDTGAQVTVAGPAYLKKCGLKPHHLQLPPHNLKHVGGDNLEILGSYMLPIKHAEIIINELVYFVKGFNLLFLSLDACKRLKLIHSSFPHVRVDDPPAITSTPSQPVHSPSLPRRVESLPYPPTEENIPLLEKCLLEQFSSSTFNVNTNPLPTMTGDPQHIHVKDGVVPTAAHIPIPIPAHWKSGVKQQLDSDVEKGILYKLPPCEPVDWCMRMVCVPKPDGSPRRTIDFQPLNKFCKRETCHPYHLVR